MTHEELRQKIVDRLMWGQIRNASAIVHANRTCDAILAFAGVHVVAALFESWKQSENLVKSMITGRKRA